jgi:hypothetical protein
MVVVVRAHVYAWRGRGRFVRELARRSRHVLTSVLLVVAGLAGMLAGAALVGRWCLGLTLMAEAAGALWFGLMRDDGKPLPRRAPRTVGEQLEAHRRPW